MPENQPQLARRRRRRRHRRRRPDDDPGPAREAASRSRAAPARVARGGGPDGRPSTGPTPVGLATPEAFEGVDIALFSAGGGTSQGAGARGRRSAARTVIDNSSAWRMDPACRSSCSQVNPDDLALARGDHREPQLLHDAARAAADGAARRASASSGSSSTPTRPSRAPAHKAIVELEEPGQGPRRGPRRRSRRLPAPDRVQRPARTSTCSSTTGTRRRSGRSSPRAGRSSTCRTSGSAARPSASRCSSATRRRSTSRPATRSRPTEARDAVRARSRAWSSRTTRRRTSTRSRPRPPGRDEMFVGRVRQDPSIDGRPRPRVLGRQRQPAQGRRDERRRDRRAARRARLGPQGDASASPSGPGGRTA